MPSETIEVTLLWGAIKEADEIGEVRRFAGVPRVGDVVSVDDGNESLGRVRLVWWVHIDHRGGALCPLVYLDRISGGVE